MTTRYLLWHETSDSLFEEHHFPGSRPVMMGVEDVTGLPTFEAALPYYKQHGRMPVEFYHQQEKSTMSLEDRLMENTAALITLNGTLVAMSKVAPGVAAQGEPAKAGKPPKATASTATPTAPAPPPPASAPGEAIRGPEAPNAAALAASPADEEYYKAEIQPRVMRTATEKGMDVVISTLKLFNVEHAKKVPKEKWPELIAAFDKVLKPTIDVNSVA